MISQSSSYADRAKKSAIPIKPSRSSFKDVSFLNGDSTQKPVANVWDVRKEQMAQRMTRPIEQQDPSSSSPPTETHKPSPPIDTSTDATSDDDDPFVVRMPPHLARRPSRPSPPLKDDSESWPEVGKAPTSPPCNTVQPRAEGPLASKDQENHLARKSEKPKWVPIPPEELQAVADEQQPHSRTYPLQHRRAIPSLSHGTPPSSGSSSQYGHNASASAGNISGRVSASHSQTQSRSHSVHSSPRTAIRGRYLPDTDEPPIPAPTSMSRKGSNRSTRESSPQRAPPFVVVDPRTLGIPPLPPLTVYPPAPPPPPAFSHYGYAPSMAYGGTSTPPYMYGPYSAGVYEHPPYAFWNGAPPPPLQPQSVRPTLSRDNSGRSTHVPMNGNADKKETSGSGNEEAVRKRGKVVFGSFDLPEGERAPSTAPATSIMAPIPTFGSVVEGASDIKGAEETRGMSFSVGVAPGEAGPSRVRTRIHSGKAKVHDGQGAVSGGENGNGSDLVDLTDAETQAPRRWEFGTTSVDVEGGEGRAGRQTAAQSTPPSEPYIPTNGGPPLIAPHPTHHAGLSTLLSSSGTQLSSIPVPDAQEHEDEWEWEVKDFGYGFGDVSGTGYAQTVVREERLAREQERERERKRDWEREREAAAVSDAPLVPAPSPVIRPRRASYNGRGYPGNDGFVGRRGRGFPPNGGRGYGGRGRGFQGVHPQHQRQGSFHITPPPHFQALPPPTADPLYAPPGHMPPYLPGGYEPYGAPGMHVPPPPVPMPGPVPPLGIPPHAPPAVPQTALPFPLDPTRYYLLGQLEYYLSPQNMAQDFFLRQRIDSRGWIPISLIASFNRVRQLTPDIQLVREVLCLSSLVHVRDDWVRMMGWEQFVLPNAPRSTVEPEPALNENHEAEDGSAEEEAEEEEEDVVFVLER